jgi:tetratricopeptide (TPR) repeat protein
VSDIDTITQNRTLKRLAERARELAVAGDWEYSVKANQEILKHSPQDSAAANRLGKALDQLGRIEEAIEAYRSAAEMDPGNIIAQRNVERLELLRDKEPPPATNGKQGKAIRANVFIEETGKTYVTELVRPNSGDALARLSPASEVELRTEEETIAAFDHFGNRLGVLEPIVSRTLRQLIEAGNRYEAYVVALSGRTVRIIIREVYRHPDVPAHLSLPAQAKMPAPRPYIRDSRAPHELGGDLYYDDEDGDDDDEGDEDSSDSDVVDIDDEEDEDDIEPEEVVGEDTDDDEDDTPIVRSS